MVKWQGLDEEGIVGMQEKLNFIQSDGITVNNLSPSPWLIIKFNKFHLLKN